ncbi:MAG: hypothetical protein NXH95_11980 [Pseudomonadaceae bacterium]|nr:hypothetical protein [Pseudomonadaceae bacterium]
MVSMTSKQKKVPNWVYILGLVVGLVFVSTDELDTVIEGSAWASTGDGNLVQEHLQRGQIPPTIDLPIQNIPQETNVWCWAAVSQQIIMATRGQQGTPPQCALVGMANGHHPQSCCNNPAPCTQTGSLEQIQGLIQHFGGRSSSIVAPTNPMVLYETLARGHAVVLAVRSSPYSGHVVVLRGMAWQPGPNGLEPVLLINDPMAYFTQPVPFRNIAQHWEAAIVVS